MAGIQQKESPFTPGRPVPVEYFIARLKEIERLKRAMMQTTTGRNENIFITGERGIGKSSLASLVRILAEKEYNMVGTHCLLGGVRTLPQIMRVVFQRLLQQCNDKTIFESLKSIFGSFIKGVELFGIGIEFTDNEQQLQNLVDNFLPLLRSIQDKVGKAGKKGLVLILDDLNGIASVPEFAEFLKSFVDELATSQERMAILLILVGLEERRQAMVESQPSVARIFDIVDLPPMSEDESKNFFSEYFSKAGMKVDSDALTLMVDFSAGLPMLMHEVGDAVFWQDTDERIDGIDARRGIIEAAKIVGRKYIGPQVSNVFRNKVYSSILMRMGEKLPIGVTFKRQELLKDNAPEKEQKNLDNFLNKVKKLGIMEDAEIRGEYKFVNPLYHLFVWYEAKNVKS